MLAPLVLAITWQLVATLSLLTTTPEPRPVSASEILVDTSTKDLLSWSMSAMLALHE